MARTLSSPPPAVLPKRPQATSLCVRHIGFRIATAAHGAFLHLVDLSGSWILLCRMAFGKSAKLAGKDFRTVSGAGTFTVRQPERTNRPCCGSNKGAGQPDHIVIPRKHGHLATFNNGSCHV